jgi:outer membrane lipoprotein-sorting protein
MFATGVAGAGPAGLLRAAAEADQRLSYTGVRVVRAFGGEEEREQRVRVSHLAPDRTRIEYLSPDSGNVLLESGGGRWYYSQRRGRWRPISWLTSRSDLDLLLQNYRVRREGSGMVAGRRVLQLLIEPRHPGNPSKRIWIDPSCRMTLREEVRNSEGRLIASSAFEQFELVQVPASLFEPPTIPATRAAAPALPFAPLRPRYVPPGYQEVRQSGLRRGPSEGVHLRYTDGLGTISLFQFRGQPGDRPGSPQGREQERPWGGHQRGPGTLGRPDDQPRLSRQIGDLHCTVMGDIGPDELRKLLDSLRSQ